MIVNLHAESSFAGFLVFLQNLVDLLENGAFIHLEIHFLQDHKYISSYRLIFQHLNEQVFDFEADKMRHELWNGLLFFVQ